MGLIFERPPLTVIEEEIPHALAPTNACRRCPLSQDARTVCMTPASYEQGALLAIAEKPGEIEDREGYAQAGKSGTWLREAIARWWDGPVVYENAVRCAPGNVEVTDSMIDACRPYLAGLLRDVKPSRVLTLGAKAMLSVFGRSIAPMNTRGGYGWLSGGVPVFELMHPAFALRNRFTKAWFLHDLKWALTAAPPTMPPWKLEMVLVEDDATAEECVDACEEAGACSYDCETWGLMFHPEFRLLAVAVCPDGTDRAYVWGEKGLADALLRRRLAGIMGRSIVRKDGHNLKFDVHAIEQGLGVDVLNQGYDSRLGRKLLDAEADGRLEAMEELVGMGGCKAESELALAVLKRRREPPVAEGQESLFGTPTPRASTDRMKYLFGDLPKPILYRRNATDAIATRRLVSHLVPQIDREPWSKRMFHDLLTPLSRAIGVMERNGVRVNTAALEAASDYFRLRREELIPKLRAYGEFDVGSADQVADLLFKTLGLPAVVITDKGNPSTNREGLDAIADKHPIVPTIIEYRWFTRMLTQYGCGEDGKGGILAHVQPDQRVHPTFDPSGTRVGRLNCTDPSLHTIPREESDDHRKEGKMIRDAFVAEPGWRLLRADYSQIELRVLAYLANDELMIDAFRRGEDIHRRTALEAAWAAWHLRPEQVGKVERTKAKKVNFGLIYGQKDKALAQELHISEHEAGVLRNAILGAFKGVRAFAEACLAHAKRKGEVWTKFDGERGRRRSLWRIADNDGKTRSTAENGSLHTPVCGTAADFSMRSLVACQNWIEEDCVPARLILSIHDELMFEVKEEAVPEVAWQVKRIMESWPMGDVPLLVDLKEGQSWGSMVPYVVE